MDDAENKEFMKRLVDVAINNLSKNPAETLMGNLKDSNNSNFIINSLKKLINRGE